MDAQPTVLLGLRVWLGVVMLLHGRHHLTSLDGTASWFASKGFRQARLQARASAAGELGIGTALVFGVATPFAAAGLIATMVVAFWSIHRFAGFFVFARPDEGYEYVATLVLAAAVVATLGPGALALDQTLGIDLRGWAGFGVAAAGFLAGAMQLAVFWRHPDRGAED